MRVMGDAGGRRARFGTFGGMRRGGLGGELLLAALPTLIVLATVSLLSALRHERILFASLASSAFLIYRDPAHPMNGVRTMVGAHLVAVACGVGAALLLGAGYAAVAAAMLGTILILVLANLVHPPAISTALGFAFFAHQTDAAGVFLLSLGLLAALVILQRSATWAVRRVAARAGATHEAHGESR